jgi:hypothetical protein
MIYDNIAFLLRGEHILFSWTLRVADSFPLPQVLHFTIELAAVISANNIRGYPDPEVLKRLKNKGIETRLSFSYGDIVFTINRQWVLNGS